MSSAVPPCADTDALDADALIRRIREAGLVGMGGATFPTDIKANIGKVETLIANACECEPYITADDALLCTDADQATEVCSSPADRENPEVPRLLRKK